MADERKKPTTQNPLNLMAKRLGVFYQQPTATTIDYTEGIKNERSLMARRMGLMYKDQSVDSKTLDSDTVNTESTTKSTILEGLDNQMAMLEFNGGHLQQERMIYDKRRSLDRAVLYSYQAADVIKVDAEDGTKPVRALINPNKLKEDYDEKVLSIGFEYGFQAGDVFEWVGTGTKWIIYLQQLTELAYFRGDIRKCSYSLTFLNQDGDPETVYVAVRGPAETKINSITYNGISHDIPNNSLDLYVPKTDSTLWFFNRNNNDGVDSHTSDSNTRQRIFYLKPLFDEGLDFPITAWGTESANWISMPGVIEVTALENYADEQRDDLENLIAGAIKNEVEQNVEDYNDETVEATIEGETFIKPMISQVYTYKGTASGEFIISDTKKCPLKIIEQDSSHIVVKWMNTYSGQFKIVYRESSTDAYGITTTNDIEKVVVVESLY